MEEQSASKTIVVGLDGAGFDLLGPWLDDGELPNVQRVIDEGVSGELESVLPPVTSPNWKAYATGKNPGKLGIFWWRNIDTENQRVYVPTERYSTHTEYWELIAEHTPAGVLGVPTTYPPKELRSFMVSGAPDAKESGFTYPPSIEQDLRERFDYRITKRHQLRGGADEAFEEVFELIDRRFTAAKYLLDRYDVSFLQVTTFYINSLHHSVWDDERTLQAWNVIDEHLESFLDEGDNVVLMSDHGHNEIETVFRINRWLIREGYLSYDTRVSNTLYRMGINAGWLKRLTNRIDRAVPTVDVRESIDRLVPQWFMNHLPDEQGQLGGSKHSRANWDETDALASAQGPIYLTVDPGTERYEEIREELIGRLEQLTTPDGRPIARRVMRAEEVYSGAYVEEGPDLVIDQAPGVYISEKVGTTGVFDDEDEVWSGVNKRYGLFAATGPAFTTGTIDHISILDLAPTLLHLENCEIPTDMDGRVRNSVFAADSDARTREARYRSTDTTTAVPFET